MAESHILQNAHDFVVSNPQFMNNPQITHIHEHEKQANEGLKILLEASIPAAAYDSSEHPLHCHPGTRYRYIDQIGPAGVGKSAIAQSCAEEFAAQNKLAAAFFSRPNQRDNPQRLFTSISYQWASKCKPYAEILKLSIHDDPTINLPPKEKKLPRVIIIDGLDECASETAQQAIIEIITLSIRDDTTPFIWIFCSRLEPHLIATFSSPEVSAVTHEEELTVSREIDNEIAKYLTDELAKLGKEHNLPPSWPRERDIGTIVDLSSGLFIYASTVVRFIGDRNSFGPEEQLQAVLSLAMAIAKDHSEHPLSELDLFYLLIIRRVPAKVLQAVQWILLATTIPYVREQTHRISQFLNLSSSQFHAACRTIHSVMKIEESNVVFYHASFMDFMENPQRSKQFCIRSESGFALREDLTQRLQVEHTLYSDAYNTVVIGYFSLCSTLLWDANALVTFSRFNFQTMASPLADLWLPLEIDKFFKSIPEDHRSKIVESCRHVNKGVYQWDIMAAPYSANWDRSYILGHGRDKCICWCDTSDDTVKFVNCLQRPASKRVAATESPSTRKAIYTFMQRIKLWKPRPPREPSPSSSAAPLTDSPL
ncbi:hypothetical protein P691DRAFT_761327 [Macrolepiota fuliginosa MF-IS2]|uniref:Nephrocystin 3-like N-terminal domain-containing protein n=1 Tax=Macrolepiota fuliginosa MF-IS2 TaxID=1400762 RepID=A0A9P5XCG4_9AGAR|nr:hypothetical protein P691DRAFT_761327 [Macrolepiota fuliginosa MF-IS2]